MGGRRGRRGRTEGIRHGEQERRRARCCRRWGWRRRGRLRAEDKAAGGWPPPALTTSRKDAGHLPLLGWGSGCRHRADSPARVHPHDCWLQPAAGRSTGRRIPKPLPKPLPKTYLSPSSVIPVESALNFILVVYLSRLRYTTRQYSTLPQDSKVLTLPQPVYARTGKRPESDIVGPPGAAPMSLYSVFCASSALLLSRRSLPRVIIGFGSSVANSRLHVFSMM